MARITAILLTLLPLASVRAEPSSSASEQLASRQAVLVGVVAGDDPFDRPVLDDVLAAGFAATGMRPRVEALPRGEDLLDRMQWAERVAVSETRVVFWVEPIEPATHRLFLFDPGSRTTWVRDLPRGDDADAVLESLGIMVALLASELDEGPPRGMQPVPMRSSHAQEPSLETPRSDASASPQTSSATRWVLGVEYVGTNVAGALPWHSGAGLRLGVETRAGVVVRARGGLLPRARAEGTPGLGLLRAPVSLELGYRFRRDARVRPELGLGTTVEVMHWQVRDEPGWSGSSGSTARVGLGPRAGVDLRVWRGLGLHLHLGADVWVRNPVLMVERDADRVSRLRPHPVSALVAFGVHYQFGVAPSPRASARRGRDFLHPIARAPAPEPEHAAGLGRAERDVERR